MDRMTTIKLDYPQKNEVEPSEVTVQVKGKTTKVPCSEMPDEFWDRLPKPLTQKAFQMELTEEDWVAYLDYIPEYRLTDVKGMWECIEQLQADARVSAFSSEQIESGFQRFWNDDERPDYVYYSEESAIEVANEMIESFVEDCIEGGREIITPRDEIAEHVAAVTGLEVVAKSEQWYFPRYIDGGNGIGFKVG
jgi:hypothetical protein